MSYSEQINNDELDTIKMKLPQLPPLNRVGSFIKTGMSNNQHIKTTKLSFEIWENTLPSTASRYRRPPPPLPPKFSSDTSQLIVDYSKNTPQNTLPIPSNSKKIASRNSLHNTSSIGENKLLSMKKSTIVHNNIYSSPFVGDNTGTIVKQRKRSSSSSSSRSPQRPGLPARALSSIIVPGNIPTPSVIFNIPLNKNTHLMKTLPSLPPKEKVDIYPRRIEPQVSLNNFNITSPKNPPFYRPPPSLSKNDLRNISDRTISESMSSFYSSSNYTFNNTNEFPRHSSFNSILGNKPLHQIPSVTAPTQPFSIELLDEKKLYQCYTVYNLSDIYEWLLKIYFEWFNEYVFGKIDFFQLVQLLLEFQLPNYCDQDLIDTNVDRIIESFVLQKAVRFEPDIENENNDEITIIVAGLNVQGVFTDLLPCYSHNHKYNSSYSTCYSSKCFSTVVKDSRSELKLSEIINKSVGVWTEYWKLSPEELAEINLREVKRQSFIFDLIILEERSLNLANAAIEIYGSNFDPSLLPNNPNFASMAFDIFIPLIELHKEFLLEPMFWKLKTKGKFIDGVGKIYLKWCNEAKKIYFQYTESMAGVHEIIMWEKAHSTKFAYWLKQLDNSPEIARSKLYHDVVFFGGFFKSLQNIPVTLRSIWKNTDPSIDDYEYLKMAINEIENLNILVDRIHGAASDNRKIVRFSKQLVSSNSNNTIGYININEEITGVSLNPDKIDLKLTEKTRKLFKEGILYKKRDLWLDPSPLYSILLDNYFLITEIITKGNDKKYKLIERPIPIDYLSLETKEGLHFSKLISQETLENVSPGLKQQLLSEHPLPSYLVSESNFSNVINTISYIPRVRYYSSANMNSLDDSEDTTYSFKIRNTATNESFTFLTNTLDERDSWLAAIIKCVKYVNSNQEPIFKLQCLCDIFSYDERQAPTNLPVTPEGSVIDMALKNFYADGNHSLKPISGDVNCTVKFTHESVPFVLCGVNHGIYMTLINEPNRWKRILNLSKVTRMEINTKLGLLLVLADKKLCYFTIPSILGSYYDSYKYLANNQIVGIILREKVNFFKIAEDFGNSKQLFYERKSKIIVLTPEFDRVDKQFKFFKMYKEYKLPTSNNGLLTADINDIVIFKNSFIVCSSKGALLYNNAFNDFSIPLPSMLNDKEIISHHSLHSYHPFKTTVESSSKKDSSKQKMVEYVRIDIITNKTKPIGCFQLSSTDFILIYDEAVIKINKSGEISNWKEDILVLDFYCTSASMNNEFLILVGDNLVQIYDFNYSGNIVNNKLSKLTPVQIIKGKKMKLISSQRQEDTVIVLSHPTIPGRQLLLGFYLVPR